MSRAQIIDELRLNPADIESLCGTDQGYLDQRVVALEFKPRPG